MSILTTTSKPPTAASWSGVHFSLRRTRTSHLKHKNHNRPHSLVPSLQVGASIQENLHNGLVPIATGSVERGLFEAAVV